MIRIVIASLRVRRDAAEGRDVGPAPACAQRSSLRTVRLSVQGLLWVEFPGELPECWGISPLKPQIPTESKPGARRICTSTETNRTRTPASRGSVLHLDIPFAGGRIDGLTT